MSDDNKHNIKDPKLDDYFQGCLYFTLSKLNRSINRMAEDAFKELELAPSQAFLLMALHENDYLTAGQLSETLGLKPSTITRFVDKLESRELCQREYEGKLVKIWNDSTSEYTLNIAHHDIPLPRIDNLRV